jgi:hypothetical protein
MHTAAASADTSASTPLERVHPRLAEDARAQPQHCASAVWHALVSCASPLRDLATNAAVFAADAGHARCALAKVALELALLKQRCVDEAHDCFAVAGATAGRRTQRHVALTAKLAWLVIDGASEAHPGLRQRLHAAQPGIAGARPLLSRLCLVGLAALSKTPEPRDAEQLLAGAFGAVAVPGDLLGAVCTCSNATSEAVQRCVAVLASCAAVTAAGPAFRYRQLSRAALARAFNDAVGDLPAREMKQSKRRRVDAPPVRDACDARDVSGPAPSVGDSHSLGDADVADAIVSPVAVATAAGCAESVHSPTAFVLQECLRNGGVAAAAVRASGSDDQYAECISGGTDGFVVSALFSGAKVLVKVPVDCKLVRHGDGRRRRSAAGMSVSGAGRGAYCVDAVTGAAAAPSGNSVVSAVDVVEGGICALWSTSSAVTDQYHLVVSELYDMMRSATRTAVSAIPADAAAALLRHSAGHWQGTTFSVARSSLAPAGPRPA